MKILLIQDHFRSGGTERQTILLAKEFFAAGHVVEVISFRPGGALSGTLKPLVVNFLQPFDTGLNWFAPGLLATVRRSAPDIILCMGRMANCQAGRLARALPSATVVATMRTGKALPWLYRQGLDSVAHVVANSRESAALLTHTYGVPARKVSVIHNALLFPSEPDGGQLAGASAPTAASSLRARFGASADTVVLLCVGMFRPEKNQAALIHLAAALARRSTATADVAPLPDWQLWLGGEGSERAACIRLADTLGIAQQVRFTGLLADPAAAYREADLAVLASRAESLSNFLIEAQAHGLPVIAYEAGGVRECCRPGITGDIVPAGDAEAFIGAWIGWLRDAARRRSVASLAREFAREAFHPARNAAAYLSLFQSLRASSYSKPVKSA
ncbi:hypothetical protein IMCC26134_08460 [Verrucomicrobia bacterium IMCC26134]|nr:hypothetical protein IMCC26134_08460 [Verrucomicrobia bacterium IMCC26134]